MRQQFTRWDSENFPKFDNSEYLDYEQVTTGLSSELCSYGYKIEGRWVKRQEYIAQLEADKKELEAKLEQQAEVRFGSWLCLKCKRMAPSGKDCYACLEAENTALKAEVAKLRKVVDTSVKWYHEIDGVDSQALSNVVAEYIG